MIWILIFTLSSHGVPSQIDSIEFTTKKKCNMAALDLYKKVQDLNPLMRGAQKFEYTCVEK